MGCEGSAVQICPSRPSKSITYRITPPASCRLSRNILVTELSCLSHERMKPKSVRAIGESWFSSRTLPWVILGVSTVFWFSFFALVSPQPNGPDVFVFRDAGCNWAHGRGLVAASVPTGNTMTPVLFATYTPGALFLFGLAASLFGCSGPVDTFYNVSVRGSSYLFALSLLQPRGFQWMAASLRCPAARSCAAHRVGCLRLRSAGDAGLLPACRNSALVAPDVVRGRPGPCSSVPWVSSF